MDKKTFLLTGATGYLGSYLAKILLKEGHRVYALARPSRNKSAQERVQEVVSFWDADVLRGHGDRLIVLEGDITKEYLGLNIENRSILRDEVDEIFHSGANTNVRVPFDEIKKVNVGGTINVLDAGIAWSKQGKLKKVSHISTAFVCGKHKGNFSERDLDKGQDFCTAYEKSKLEAERAVLEYRSKGLWIDIYRPAIVIGESKTGKNFQFKNIYQFIQMCRLELFKELPIEGASASIIPID